MSRWCESIGRLVVAGVAALVVVVAPARFAAGQEAVPQPRLNSVVPLGAKAGTELEVAITGDAAEGAQQLLASHPGITAAPVMTKPDRFFAEPRAVENRFTVKIAGDVPPGVYEVRLANRMGISNARSFVVGDLPETMETEPNDAADKAGEIAVNSVVNGTCDPRNVDVYRFKATKGQRLILHCAAQRLDARTDPVLVLKDAAGQELARGHDPVRLDPMLDFTAPTDGEYFVAVNDFLYAGGGRVPLPAVGIDGAVDRLRGPARRCPGRGRAAHAVRTESPRLHRG